MSESENNNQPTVPNITPEDVIAKIEHVEMVRFPHKSGQIIRWAVLTMKNGTVVIGDPSRMVSDELDDQAVAEQVAVSNAQDKVFALLEYQALEDYVNGRKTYGKFSLVDPVCDVEEDAEDEAELDAAIQGLESEAETSS